MFVISHEEAHRANLAATNKAMGTPMTAATAEFSKSQLRAIQNMDPEFIVIIQSAWCNASGVGIDYSWDGERFNNRNDAIKHGFKLRGSDDFNIGQTYGDDLIWFGWMDQSNKEDEEDARKIAEAVGLTFDPRLFALTYSKATGKPILSTEAA